MSNDLVPAGATQEAQRGMAKLTDDQVRIFTTMILGKDFTKDEAALCLAIAERTGLDPFAREIYFVKRKDKSGVARPVPQTGIDGYRRKAEESGKFAGCDEYKFDEGLTQFEMLKAGRAKPKTATVTVYKLVGGVRVPYTATVAWDEYCPKGDTFMWDKMPFNQLGKCAEAKALRMSGMLPKVMPYITEEMHQADATVTTIQPSEPRRKSERVAEIAGKAPPKPEEGKEPIVIIPTQEHPATPENCFMVTGVAEKKSAKGKKFYVVTYGAGQECTTFSDTDAATASDCASKGTPARLVIEARTVTVDGKEQTYHNLKSIDPLQSNPEDADTPF